MDETGSGRLAAPGGRAEELKKDDIRRREQQIREQMPDGPTKPPPSFAICGRSDDALAETAHLNPIPTP